MKRKVSILILLVAVLSAALGFAGRREVAGQRRAAHRVTSRVSDLRINLTPLKLNLDAVAGFQKCPLPRPKDIGCTTLCKPCITWRCREGKWVEFDISNMDDDICQPVELGEGSISVCPRGENGFCPAECGACY